MDTTGASLRLLLRAGIDPMTQMPVAAELIHRLVPSFSLSMIRVNAECAPREHYSEHFDDVSHQLFAEAGHHFSAATDDPAAFGTLLRRRGDPVGSLIDGGESFVAGATYQHLFKRNGIHHVLDVAIRDDNGPLGILGIFREQGARAFTQQEVRAVAAVYDDIVHAFRAEALPADFDESDSAVILTNADGVIEWATPTARCWLEDAAAGPERARLVLDGVLPDACRYLARVLANNDASVLPTLTLPVAGGRLRLRAYGMMPCSPGELETRVAIHLRLEMHRTLKVIHALHASTLPPQLRRLALAHYQGCSSSLMCTRLGITASTLKSYQKDLYGRLEVTSAAALVALLHRLADGVTFDLRRHLPSRA